MIVLYHPQFYGHKSLDREANSRIGNFGQQVDGIGWPALLQLISSACLLQPCSTTTLSAPSSCHMRALSLTANYASLPAAQSSICNSLAQHHSAILNPQCAIDSPVAISGHTHLPGKRWAWELRPSLSIPLLSINFSLLPSPLTEPQTPPQKHQPESDKP